MTRDKPELKGETGESPSIALTLVGAGGIIAVALSYIALFFRASKHSRAFAKRDPVLDRMGLDRLLVLHLPRAPSRAEYLRENARQVGVPIEFFEAVDGVNNENFRSKVSPSLVPNATCADIIGAIFHTHERAWRTAAKETLPTLVLEDDVILPHDFVELFRSRSNELPENYDMAFVGTSVTQNTEPFSQYLSRPDPQDPNLQTILGFWGYMVTPAGAKKLLRLAMLMRKGNRRRFQPVDLFVAHHMRQLDVFVFEPPEKMADEFRTHRDTHHVMENMRQVGIVSLRPTPSLNKPIANEESAEIEQLKDQLNQFGRQENYLQALKAGRQALKKMKTYSCWNSGSLQQNLGVTLLRLLLRTDGAPKMGANKTLMMALEAFASAIRFNEGTWLERQYRSEFPEWIQMALINRQNRGLLEVAPPDGWQQPVDLPFGPPFGWRLHPDPQDLRLDEPLQSFVAGDD